MKHYRYVLAASDGTSHDLSRKALFWEEDEYDLADLLNEGWRPVRETPLEQAQWYVGETLMEFALALILLEKDDQSPPAAP